MSDPEYDIDPSTRFGSFAQRIIRGGTLDEEIALQEAEHDAPMPPVRTFWQWVASWFVY